MKTISCLLILFAFIEACFAQKFSAKEAVKDAEGQINRKEYAAAKQSLTNAINQKPNFAIAWRLLGVVNTRIQNYEEAAAAYEKLFKLDGELSKAAYFEAGQANMKLYEYSLALRYFERYKIADSRDFSTDEQTIQRGYDLLVNREMNSCKFAQSIDFKQITDTVENMGNVINSSGDEYLPTLTSDGKILVFTSDKGGENIMVSRKKENGDWTDSKSIGKGINTSGNEGMAKLTASGRTLYFAACGREVGLGGCDIFTANFDYDEATGYDANIVKELSSKQWDSQPTISCDGKMMYFASNRAGGFGGTDIWFSTQNEQGIWAVPTNLGATINTEADEEAPYISTDAVTLYFSSDGHAGFGDMDIFRAVLENKNWTQPQNLGAAFNTPYREAGIVVNPENDIAYFASARPKGRGGLDIYKIKLKPEVAPAVDNVLIDGFVFDVNTGEPIFAAQVKIGKGNDRQIIKTDSAGHFFICLPNKSSYSYIIEKQGYTEHIGAEFFQRNKGNPTQRIEVGLGTGLAKNEVKIDPKPVPNPAPARARKNLSVYFESGKHELSDIQKEQIKQLFTQFTDKSKLQVKVTGYADDIGNKEFNLSLSEKRASFVAKFIEELKVPKEQIIYDGKGVVETNIAKHQKRRVEIVISN
jgi:outer membrane protein OmpA-like peptidoglycan-associated protein/tetratricopeptide (TPR) repeat protein